jgi:hypothetical protein
VRAVAVQEEALAENRALPVHYEKDRYDEHVSSGVRQTQTF